MCWNGALGKAKGKYSIDLRWKNVQLRIKKTTHNTHTQNQWQGRWSRNSLLQAEAY